MTRPLPLLPLIALALLATGCPGGEKPDDSSADDSSADDSSTDDSEAPPAEDCAAAGDEDGDGAADCADSDCANDAACQEDCTSGEDEDIDGATDCDDTDCAGDEACAPTLDSASPGWGWTDRETPVTLTGSGFAWATAGAPTVTFGGVPATAVTVVDANTVTVNAPTSATEGSVDIELTTSNGSATLSGAFTYMLPAIYAADGKEGLAGNLYRYNFTTGEVETLVALDYGFTGLAFDADGVLWGVASTRYNTYGDAFLATIDTASGFITSVGALTDTAGAYNHGSVPDIEWVGDRLLGWTEDSDTPIEINPSTGGVSSLGGGTGSYGSGVAYDPVNGILYAAPDGESGPLYTVDTSSGAVSAGCNLSAITTDRFYPVNSMTFQDGALYATVGNYGADPNVLVRITLADCVMETVALLPTMVDSISGNRP